MRRLVLIPALFLSYAPAFAAETTRTPAQRLTQFLNMYLESLLAPLNQDVPSRRAPLQELQTALLSERAKLDKTAQAPYDAALATCAIIAKAIDEREVAASRYHASQWVSAGQRSGVSHNRGKLSKTQRHDIARQKQQAAATNRTLSPMTLAIWTERSQQLRRAIQTSYEKALSPSK